MPIVKTPDNKLVRFPDEMPREEIKTFLASKYPEAYQQEKGFVQKVQEDWAGRDQQIQDQVDAYARGEQSMGETMAQNALSNASKFTDVAGEAVTAIPVVGPAIEKGMGWVGNKVANIPLDVVTDYAPTVGTAVSRYAEENPRTWRNLSAAGQAANLLMAGKGTAEVGNATVSAGEAALGVGKKFMNTPAGSNLKAGVSDFLQDTSSGGKPKPKLQTSADLRKASGENYDLAQYLDETFSPDEVANKVQKSLKDNAPKPIKGMYSSEDKALLNHIDEIKSMVDGELSLGDITELDKKLTSKINKFVDTRTGDLSNEGRLLYKIQSSLRQAVREAPDSPGKTALSNGKNLWSAQSMMRDLEDIAERASMTKDPATSMRTGFRNLYMDKDRVRGWPQEALDLLKKAATPGLVNTALEPITSRLLAVLMGAQGNVAGAAGAQVLKMGAGTAMEASMARKAGKIQQSIIDNAMKKVKPVNVPPPTPAETLLLPSPENMSKLPMSERQVNIARKQMERKSTLPPEAPINETAMLQLSSPENMSKLPMSERQVNIARKQMEPRKSTGSNSGTAIRSTAADVLNTPESNVTQLTIKPKSGNTPTQGGQVTGFKGAKSKGKRTEAYGSEPASVTFKSVEDVKSEISRIEGKIRISDYADAKELANLKGTLATLKRLLEISKE